MDLSLKEKYLLLCMKPHKGGMINAGTGFQYGLCGAIIMDLLLAEKLVLKGKKVLLPRYRPDSDRILQDVLTRVKKARRHKKVKTWVQSLSYHVPRYRRSITDMLVKAGYLKRERKRFLGIPYTRHYLMKQLEVQQIRDRLIDCIEQDQYDNEHELALIALLYAGKALSSLFPDLKKQREVKLKLKRVMKEQPVAETVQTVIRETGAAIAAAAGITAATSAAT